jgi:hypothetical protein
MRAQVETAFLPERSSTPDRPIVPQDFKEGARSEPPNRVNHEEDTEDWNADLTESRKPSLTADTAIVPQETNESDHREFVDQRAEKAKREEEESDLSGWMMTSD